MIHEKPVFGLILDAQFIPKLNSCIIGLTSDSGLLTFVAVDPWDRSYPFKRIKSHCIASPEINYKELGHLIALDPL